MSVNPGFGGQQFIAASLDKMRRTAALIEAIKPDVFLEVDGGIDETNVRSVCEAGCNVIVSGTGVFKHESAADGVKLLRKAACGS